MTIKAGASSREISPDKPCFLAGYPHAPRISEGVHDPLMATAIYAGDGSRNVMIVGLDLLFISTKLATRLRRRVQRATGVAASCVMVCCSHTHSGPLTAEMLAWADDPVVGRPDETYINLLEERIAEAAAEAVRRAAPAALAWTSVEIDGIGGNRHSPDGLRDPEAGVLAVKDAASGTILAVAAVYCMHPTVLHEDSKLISADFPGMARAFLRETFGSETAVLYAMGPAGNQSPRYHVTGQTFEEATRLGRLLGARVAEAVTSIDPAGFSTEMDLDAASAFVELSPRPFMTLADAEAHLAATTARYRVLKSENAPHGPLRTAECAVFGAEEAVTLARAQETGALARLLSDLGPLEVHAIRFGDAFLIGLPCEIFVEYGLEIKRRAGKKVFVASVANGESQGYIATPGATGYEADNALFDPAAGERLVSAALNLIQTLSGDRKTSHANI